jgi:hypothetical protein
MRLCSCSRPDSWKAALPALLLVNPSDIVRARLYNEAFARNIADLSDLPWQGSFRSELQQAFRKTTGTGGCDTMNKYEVCVRGKAFSSSWHSRSAAAASSTLIGSQKDHANDEGGTN